MTPIETLITIFSKLPGIGSRSARRIVLNLIRNREKLMIPLAKALLDGAERIVSCEVCGNLDTVNPCAICSDNRRDRKVICVIEDLSDLWAIERSNAFKGLYHVLGGNLSAIEGRSPDQINLSTLLTRLTGEVEEVIIATNATVEGQATAFYISDMLLEKKIRVTRLAQGVPIGGELEYLDDGTLGAALGSRKII
jgi:recombination protein RecR